MLDGSTISPFVPFRRHCFLTSHTQLRRIPAFSRSNLESTAPPREVDDRRNSRTTCGVCLYVVTKQSFLQKGTAILSNSSDSGERRGARWDLINNLSFTFRRRGREGGGNSAYR